MVVFTILSFIKGAQSDPDLLEIGGGSCRTEGWVEKAQMDSGQDFQQWHSHQVLYRLANLFHFSVASSLLSQEMW